MDPAALNDLRMATLANEHADILLYRRQNHQRVQESMASVTAAKIRIPLNGTISPRVGERLSMKGSDCFFDSMREYHVEIRT